MKYIYHFCIKLWTKPSQQIDMAGIYETDTPIITGVGHLDSLLKTACLKCGVNADIDHYIISSLSFLHKITEKGEVV